MYIEVDLYWLIMKRYSMIPNGSRSLKHMLQVLSSFPRIMVFPNFVDTERMQAVMDMAAGGLGESGLAFKKGDTVANTRNVRTSQGTFLSSRNDPTGVLSWIEERIAQVTGVPASHGEVCTAGPRNIESLQDRKSVV